MSRLDQLIAKLCPEGVEYKEIASIASRISSGGTPNTSNQDFYSGEIPWLRTQEVDWTDIYDTSVKISEEAIVSSSAKWIPTNCVIVAMYGATAAKVAINKIPLTTNQACCNIEVDPTKALYKFVFYCLCNSYKVLKAMGQGSQSNINAKIVKEFRIPVPPLPVQEEIVRILDCFTELEAELEAELETRKKQYEHYRDTLLNLGKPTGCSRIDQLIEKLCPKGVSYKPLKEIAEIKRGVRVVKNQLSETKGFPVFQNSLTPLGYNKTANVPANSTFVIAAGAAGEIGYSIHKFWAADDCYYFNSELLNNRFLYHVLSRNQHLILSKVRKASIPRLARSVLEQVNIPLLPLRVQEEIVRILDRFDKLCNDLSVGLPAEIEARRKQYEYYRDKLLTFKELEA